MDSSISGAVSFGLRLSSLAMQQPDRIAITFVERGGRECNILWSTLDRESNRAARLLETFGVSSGSMVIIALPNSPKHFYVTLGAWKLGACVLPLSAALPEAEREQLEILARPSVVVANWSGVKAKLVRPAEFDDRRAEISDGQLPDRIPCPGKAIASGGSTGRPKIIVDPNPWIRNPNHFENTGPVESLGRGIGFRPRQVQLVAGPLYHNAPFTWSHFGLFDDHKLIVMEHFDAALALNLIEHHRVSWGFLVPTMMHRLIQIPDIRRRDLSSVQSFFHSGAPCPPSLKEKWICLLGGQRLIEAYGATEAIGFTTIRGEEWLTHRGSVGRPIDTELRILDEHGSNLPPNQVGEVFLRPTNSKTQPYYYLGSNPAKGTHDGFTSVGDLGYVDEEGYLFLADRRTDLILSGGVNIYPAEVEAAFSDHPEVADIAVIGLPDADWGKRVHAVIQPRDPAAPPTVTDLDAHCRKRLVSFKAPKSYDFVEHLPRQESGKLRRNALVAERATGSGRLHETPRPINHQ